MKLLIVALFLALVIQTSLQHAILPGNKIAENDPDTMHLSNAEKDVIHYPGLLKTTRHKRDAYTNMLERHRQELISWAIQQRNEALMDMANIIGNY